MYGKLVGLIFLKGNFVLVTGSFLSRMLNRFWVKTMVVPQNPLSELKLDPSKPIIYVLDQNSASDLLALKKACSECALANPYKPLKIHGKEIPAVIYLHDWNLFTKGSLKKDRAVYMERYQQLLDLHLAYADVDIQLIPVTCFWGRHPGKQNPRKAFSGFSNPSGIKKAWSIMTAGKDHLIRFNAPISVRHLVEKSSDKNSKQQAYKLARLALHYFTSQHRSSRGPQIPARKQMIKNVLASSTMQQTIQEHSEQSGQSIEQVRAECRQYLQEISSNFSYRFLRLFRAVLTKVWNGIYQGIEVHHAQRVREATQSGAEIVYMPCHRSHMDYLLLSYLLYEEGLVPPHIAAGVNLNFFPAGGIFRRSGAFFLRRSFKNNPLYGKVFKAYFAMLFKQGYPIEFFTEGGRSRTGRLLPAKTGLLAMSVQTFLEQPERNVMIVPVYIGYDHIMEVSTYMKELSGQKKESESVWQVLGIIKKLRNFGRAFVSFGEPINLKQYFDQQQPLWRQQGVNDSALKRQVNHLANQVMTSINSTTAVNALPLCAAILLASQRHQLGKRNMLALIRLHQAILASSVGESGVTYPQQSADKVYAQALAMNKFSEAHHVVRSDEMQSSYLTYYRNTIVHLFALPALLSFAMLKLAKQQRQINLSSLLPLITPLLEFVEAEYFIEINRTTLSDQVQGLLEQLQQNNVLQLDADNISISDEESLILLSKHLIETRRRYCCVLNLLAENSELSDLQIIQECKKQLAEQALEPFDEKVFKVFIKQLDRKTLTEAKLQSLLNILSEEE